MAFNVGTNNEKPKKFRLIDNGNSIDVYVKQFDVVHNGITKTVWKSGSTVTYVVDTSTSYTEEVDSDATCLSPKTFTPAKSGWTFVGWRDDTSASSSVLSSKVMDSDPITLYAIYSQEKTFTFTSYNNTQTVKGTRYYNASGNVADASITAPTGASYSGWSWRGWSLAGKTGSNADVGYANGATISGLNSNSTYYGLYQQTVTGTFYSGNNKATSKAVDGIRYYNAYGNTADAKITAPTGATLSDWTWRGWSAANATIGNASVGCANGASVTLVSNTAFYGLYQQSITCTFYSGLSKAKSATASGTRYYNSYNTTVNASITAPTGETVSGWTWRGWSAANTTTGNASVSYANGGSISGLTAAATFYGLYNQTITVTYYDNSTTAKTTTGTRYHNSYGNYSNPSFTLTQSAKSNWSSRGWSTGTAGDSSVTYANATAFTRDSNITLYGTYNRSVTVTYYDNSSTAKTTSGTAYMNYEGTIVKASFTLTQASVSGWSARGWSTETAGNSSATYKNATAFSIYGNVTLYGMYSKTVTVTYYDNSTTAKTTSGTAYRNYAGTVIGASFTLAQSTRSGMTARGWSTSNSGSATVTYNNNTAFTRDSDVTLYGLYSQTITVTYYNNSSTAATTTGTRYWAPAGYINPSFTLAQASVSGWSARGWSTGTAGNSSVSYNNNTAFTRDSNVTLYGTYSKSVTITYYNNSSTASTTSGTAYRNYAGTVIGASFTLTQASVSGWSAAGWSTGTSGSSSSSYSNATAFTRDSNVTLYGRYTKTVTVTYYNNSTSAKTATGTAYRNYAGTETGASFTLAQASVSGWSARGWSTGTAGNSSISYNNNTAFTRTTNCTLYGAYSATITLSYNGNSATSGSTASHTGTAYRNYAGTVIGATFSLKSNGFARTNYIFSKWASGSASGTQYAAGASVTLTASTTFYAVWIQSVYNFSYTGGTQKFTAPVAGTYKLEVYGAQGGNCTAASYSSSGGKGGYAYGNVKLTAGQVIYVVVGGAGSTAGWGAIAAGGYNGGGKSHSINFDGYQQFPGSGGGATHIGTFNSTLAARGSTSGLYIVAGGGGGAGGNDKDGEEITWAGGTGGGTSGGAGSGSMWGCTGKGGTQSSGGTNGVINDFDINQDDEDPNYISIIGSFGQGGYGVPGGAGGGGLYGGGVSYGCGAGGGGSGYVGGCISGTTGMSNGQKTGHGSASITFVSAS